MVFIKLNKSNKESFEKLLKFSFPPEDEEENEWTKLFLKADRIWDDAYGYFDGNTLISTYSSYSGQFMIRDEVFDVKFIENVATLPSYRKMGLIKKGLKEEIERNFDSKFNFLCLGPFKHQFYRNLGFEIAMDRQKLEFDLDFLSKKVVSKGYSTKIGYLKQDSDLREDILQVNKWLWDHCRYNQARAPKLFKEVFYQMSKIFIAVSYDENGIPKGYLIYSEKDRSLKIDSMQYVDLQAFYSLKQFLLSYQDQANKILFRNLPPDFPIDLLIDNLWLNGKKLSLQNIAWHMFRIVNLEKVLRKICKKFPDKEIYLEVSDDLINENCGVFLISKKKIGKIEKYSGKIDVKISISDLVPLISGKKSSFDLYLTGKLIIPEIKTIYNSKNLAPQIIFELDEIFPKMVTFSFS
ncbi:MAG: GNAT family N-acetyltransferase [Promethearchaeota archaeon]